jgi:thymidylate synthase
MKTYTTIHEAYLGSLQDVYFNPDYKSAPRGLPCREKTDYSFRVLNPVNEPIVTKDLERNKVIADYTAKEVELYDSCTNKAEDFGKASKFWLNLANPDGTVNSAYGYLIWEKKSHGNDVFGGHVVQSGHGDRHVPVYYTPWEWAKQSLIKDKDTRQAYLRFSLPEHAWFGNKDQTCTMHGNFLIRNNQLHLSIVMRSNDLVLGLVYDLPWFISLIDLMIIELQQYYPGLTKGTYTHTAHSSHIYERNEETVLKMLGLSNGDTNS